jgi:hypothetical protein
MFPIKIKLTAIFIFMLVLISAAAAQDQQASPSQGNKEPVFTFNKDFRSKIIDLKNRNPHELTGAIMPLGSGAPGAMISPNEQLKTITVRDFPENIATIEAAIKRLDVPAPAAPPRAPAPAIEYHVQVLVASNTATASDEVPAELKDVVKQLQGTLAYKNYSLMASAIHRGVLDSSNGLSSNGVVDSKLFNVSLPPGEPVFYEYTIAPSNLDTNAAGITMLALRLFSFRLRVPLNLGGQEHPIQYESVGFGTPIVLREGEKVVVGTTTMGDKGLIVVLSAKVLSK